MDGVSSASSIIAVLDLSAKLITILFQFSKEVKNARPQIERFLCELQALKSTLEGGKKLLDGNLGKLQTSESLSVGLEGCLSQLKDLDNRLRDMLEGKSTGTGKTARAMSRLGIRALRWPFENKEVDVVISTLERYRNTLSAALEIDQTAHILRIAQEFVLSKLPNVKDAAFDSHADEHNARCHPETRISLLQEILDWAEDPNTRSIFWLNGMAGTGKSTIARTVADSMFIDRKKIGGSFFFKRGEKDRGNVAKLFSTIASQLAAKDPNFAVGVQGTIEDDPTVIGKNLKSQFDQLLYQPLERMHDFSGTLVLIFDALDECEEERDIQILISILSQVRNLKSVPVKVFLTSRPELPIRLGFADIQGEYKDIVLHEIPAQIIHKDIFTFLTTELERIGEKFNKLYVNNKLASDWPGPDVIQELSTMAVPLFIFAATICRFIDDHAWCDPVGQLAKILEYQAQGSEMDKLDATYRPVLDHLVVKNQAAQKTIVEEFHTVIGSLVLLAEPLSPTSLSYLLDIPVSMVKRRLMTLHSVFSVPISDEGLPIRMFHLSFRDFLTDPEKRGTNLFWIDEKLVNKNLATNSIRLLSSHLKEDICDLKEPGADCASVSATVLDTHLPPHVRYSCLYWIDHLIDSGENLTNDHLAYQFLRDHFLHWLEALSLLGKISESIHMLQRLKTRTNGSDSTCFAGFLHDATRFILTFKPVVGSFPLQLYYSAITFAPKTSLIRKTFEHSIVQRIPRLPDVKSQWDSCLQTLELHTGLISDIIYHPSGRQLITVSAEERVIRVWESDTGTNIHESPFPKERTVFLSQCGQRFATKDSFGRTVQAFDIMTGEEIWSYISQLFISDVIFSPGGESIFLLSSWKDHYDISVFNIETATSENFKLNIQGTGLDQKGLRNFRISPDNKSMAACIKNEVFIWETGTGKRLNNLKEHEMEVIDLAYSPDCERISTLDRSNCVYIWGIGPGPRGKKLEIRDPRAAFGWRITFSADGEAIFLRCRNTILCWNSETGERLNIFTAKSSMFDRVAIPPDGKTIATTLTGSYNVCIWDICSQVVELNPDTEDDSPRVRFIAFPGKFDILFSLWDEGGNLLLKRSTSSDADISQVVASPYNKIWKYVLSSDGKFIAFVFQGEKSFRLWDIEEASEHKMPEKHADRIHDITFSVDSKHIATFSYDRTIRLWNPVTGEATEKLDVDDWQIQSQPETVGFSADGHIVAFSCYGGPVYLWHVAEKKVVDVTPYANYGYMTIAVSAGGKKIAARNSLRDIMLWDPKPGAQMQKIPFAHGIPIKHLSFSMNGQYLKTSIGWISLSPDTCNAESTGENRDVFLLRENWLYRGGKRLMWIPPDYRSEFLTWHGNRVAMIMAESRRIMQMELNFP